MEMEGKDVQPNQKNDMANMADMRVRRCAIIRWKKLTSCPLGDLQSGLWGNRIRGIFGHLPFIERVPVDQILEYISIGSRTKAKVTYTYDTSYTTNKNGKEHQARFAGVQAMANGEHDGILRDVRDGVNKWGVHLLLQS